MRILHTIYDDVDNPWLGGGGAFRTLEICKQLADRHEITILSGRYPGAPVKEHRDGMRIVRVGSERSYAISRIAYSAAASQFVSGADPDLWVYSFSAFAPLIASEHKRSGSLLECFHVMQEHASEKQGLIGHAAALIETETLRTYDDIISISPSVMERIASVRGRPDGLRLVYTGVDRSCFIDDPVDGDYILYFGRLDTYTKGLDLLFEAFGRLKAPEVRLVIGGRGTAERMAELEALVEKVGISDRVEFTGPVDTNRRTELYRNSLFNVAPSRYEGWCIAAIEASAAGKAIVGTRIPGLMDAVRDGETGLLAESENIDQITDAMRTLIEDDAMRSRLGRQGREWANQFTWDQIAFAQEAVYNQVVEA